MNVLLIVLTAIAAAKTNAKARIKNHPYQVELLNNHQHWCGGALISRKIVMSVASCTFGIPKENLTIVPGSSISGNRYVKQYKIFHIHNHKKYDPSRPGNDISVIFPQLGIATDTTFVHHVFLGQMYYPPGSVGVLSSWTSKKTKQGRQYELYSTRVQFRGPKTCTEDYSNYKIAVPRGEICAYDKNGILCKAESGGALVVKDRLVGLVSKIYRPICAGHPGIFTSIYHHKEYIEKVVKRVLFQKKSKKEL